MSDTNGTQDCRAFRSTGWNLSSDLTAPVFPVGPGSHHDRTTSGTRHRHASIWYVMRHVTMALSRERTRHLFPSCDRLYRQDVRDLRMARCLSSLFHHAPPPPANAQHTDLPRLLLYLYNNPSRTLYIDLDGTLYAIENGYEMACRNRVFQFMADEYPDKFTDCESAKRAWHPHFRQYNQTLRALRAGLGLIVDTEKYWTVTRGNPSELLGVNEDAKKVLETVTKNSKEIQCIILTNCAEKQAKECLEVLGLLEYFDEVYGADAMGADSCKPEINAFEKIKKLTGFEYGRTVFFEDSVKNLAAGKQLGMRTVLIKSETTQEEGKRDDGFQPDHTIDAVTVEEMRRILPELF